MSLNPHGAQRQSGFIEASGISVHYLIAGAGSQNVLVLHGWGGSIDSVLTIVEDLARDYRVVALDLPGHGRSDLPPGSWTVGDYATCVLDVAAHLQVVNSHVIAHSFGGRITIKLAAMQPRIFRKLVLVNAAGVRLPPTLKLTVRRMFASLAKYLGRHLGSWGARLRDTIYRWTASRDYLAAGPLRGTFSKVVGEDLTPLLPLVMSPTLLIWGDSDNETPLAIGTTMNRLIPQSRLVVLKHAGHFSYIDQFGQFRLLVRNFLSTQ
jgi:pimeloyl-ACP methyl ester carboxylesterase